MTVRFAWARGWRACAAGGAHLLVFGLVTLLTGCEARGPAPLPAISPLALLSAPDVAGFARADRPRAFVFPADHGPHRDFRSEWWYFTGVLHGAGAWGYQLTFFRQALAAQTARRSSAFRTRDVYMAHLAVSRLDDRDTSFHAEERVAREGGGLAGATPAPFAVWTDAWRVESDASSASTARDADGASKERKDSDASNDLPAAFPLHLRARGRDVSLDLHLEVGRGPVLQGDAGLSRKGSEPGQASYYHSWTRLPTHGQVSDARGTADVQGLTWLDREWSTAPLPAAVRGWDWLGLSLSDGRDLMVFRLRGPDALTPTQESVATLIEPDGRTRSFASPAFSLEPSGAWTSPRTGVRYPAGFVLDIHEAGLHLTVTPLRADQELTLSVRYWEGAVAAHGQQTRAGAAPTPLQGEGYLELTGYEP